MPIKLPKLIAIDHDDYHAEFVGKTPNGKQFFLTEPFEPTTPMQAGNEFVALFLFDRKGKFLEAFIDEFGPRASMDTSARDAMVEKRLAQLGDVSFERIEIAPFQVEKFGTIFGLIPNEMGEEDDEDDLSISLMPGDYMAFSEPWDSGDYDT
ncbi:MAG: hypothetical protein LBQ20_10820 [Rhodanobacter sp.]|nr:hypothetical protein [Rhodanobacter sp.]